MLTDLAHLSLIDNGVFIASRGQFALSTPMTENDMSQTLEAVRESFSELKPIVERFLPHLIRD